MRIKFFYDGVKLRVKRSGEIKRFLERVIAGEMKKPGDLIFIFTDDKTLLRINREFLKHDYYTDVISFDYSSGNSLNGEIYISVDSVKRNASNLKVRMKEELVRVMIHGILHLCGYDDGKESDKEIMFIKQEALVKEFSGGR